ncbi:hypothetical protein Tco_0408593 [Tanacetum coccineum]
MVPCSSLFSRNHSPPTLRLEVDDVVVPRLELTGSGHGGRLEKFPNYVARQLGFKDGNECPELSKLAADYVRSSKGFEDELYLYFSSEKDDVDQSLCEKLVKELERCILGYFAFHWSQTDLMINGVLSDGSDERKLKNLVLTATRKQRFDKVTNDLKVTRAFATMVEEMKVIGTNTQRKGDSEDAFTEVMGAVAHSNRSPVLLFMGGGMGAGKSTVLKEVLKDFYIPAEVHPTALERGKTIFEFPAGKVGVYTRIFDACGYRIPFTKFFITVLKYFRVHISQLSPVCAARVSHFEVLTGMLDLAPSVTLFRAFYTRSYSDGLFSFAKRSTSAPTCFPKPPDSIKNWADHFFWVDSRVLPIFVPLYTRGILEKDPTPYLTTRQEQAVKLLESHKDPFRRYPECFLCLVGLSPYYPFDENSYPAFEYPDGTEMCLFDFIKTADPRKVQAVEVQNGADQVKLLDCTEHCFMPLVPRAPGGSSSAAGAEVSAPVEESLEDVAADDAYLELVGPAEDTVVAKRSEEGVVTE